MRARFTKREIEVLECLVDGGSNADVAEDLGLSRGAIKFHLKNLRAKLGVSSRTQIVVAALRAKVVQL